MEPEVGEVDREELGGAELVEPGESAADAGRVGSEEAERVWGRTGSRA